MAEKRGHILLALLRAPAFFPLDSLIQNGFNFKNASSYSLVAPFTNQYDHLFYINNEETRVYIPTQGFCLFLALFLSICLVLAKQEILMKIYYYAFIVTVHFCLWTLGRVWNLLKETTDKPLGMSDYQTYLTFSLMFAYQLYSLLLCLSFMKSVRVLPVVLLLNLGLMLAACITNNLLNYVDLFGSLGFIWMSYRGLMETLKSGRKHFFLAIINDVYSVFNELGLFELAPVVWKRYQLDRQLIAYWFLNLVIGYFQPVNRSNNLLMVTAYVSFSSLFNIVGLSLFVNRCFYFLLLVLNQRALKLSPRLMTETPVDPSRDSAGMFYDYSVTFRGNASIMGWFEFAVAMSLSSTFHENSNPTFRVSCFFLALLAGFAAFLEAASMIFEDKLQNTTQREPFSQHIGMYSLQIVRCYWRFLIYAGSLLFLLPLGVGLGLLSYVRLENIRASADFSNFIFAVLVVSILLVAVKTVIYLLPKLFIHPSGGELLEPELATCLKKSNNIRNGFAGFLNTNSIAHHRSNILFFIAFLYTFLDVCTYGMLFVMLTVAHYVDMSMELEDNGRTSNSLSKLIRIEFMDFLFLSLYAHLKIWTGVEKLSQLWKEFAASRTRLASLKRLSDEELDQIYRGSTNTAVCAICYSVFLNVEQLPSALGDKHSDHDDVHREKSYKAFAWQMIRKTPCNHVFHANCIRRWLYFKPSCPLCIQPIGKSIFPQTRAEFINFILTNPPGAINDFDLHQILANSAANNAANGVTDQAATNVDGQLTEGRVGQQLPRQMTAATGDMRLSWVRSLQTRARNLFRVVNRGGTESGEESTTRSPSPTSSTSGSDDRDEDDDGINLRAAYGSTARRLYSQNRSRVRRRHCPTARRSYTSSSSVDSSDDSLSDEEHDDVDEDSDPDWATQNRGARSQPARNNNY